MDKLEDLSGLHLSELTNCKIIGSKGVEIGRLVDCAFKYSENSISLSKFIVGGSRIEELLERLRLKPDIDPVFSIDVIEKISPQRISLGVSIKELKSTHVHQDALDDDEIKLSELGKMKIIDSENRQIGNIIDMKFDINKFAFIIGDGPIIEWAESAGFRADVDFLLSPDSIKSINADNIVLSKRKDELQSTFIDYVTDYKERKGVKLGILENRAKASVYFPRVQ